MTRKIELTKCVMGRIFARSHSLGYLARLHVRAMERARAALKPKRA